MPRHHRRDPMFRCRRYDDSIVVLCVRWYVSYRLSLRDRQPKLNLLQHRHNLLNRKPLLLHGKLLALPGPVCRKSNRQNGPIPS